MQMRIIEFMKRCFIAQSLSCSPFHRTDITEILLKGTHYFGSRESPGPIGQL